MPEEYQFNRRAGQCNACGRRFEHGEEHFSALLTVPPPPAKKRRSEEAKAAAADDKAPAAADAGQDRKEGGQSAANAGAATPSSPSASALPYRRLDFCASCWKPEEAGSFFCFWKTAIPEEVPDKDKPLAKRIDAETVYEMFRRLEGQPELEKQKFRFILALILMRKKRLRFTGVASSPQGDHLVLEDRAEAVTHKVRDPGLAEEEIDSLKSAVDHLLRSSGQDDEGPTAG